MSLKFEINRKLVHLLSILYIVVFVLVETFYSFSYAIGFMMILLIVTFFYEEIRLREARNKFENYFKKFTGKLTKFHRLKEEKNLSGSVYMILGILISLVIFDRRIALAVILMTILGDLTAALIGKRFGKIKILNKTLEGTLAGFFVNFLVGIIFIRGPLDLVYVNTLDLLPQLFLFTPNFAVIILMAISASLAELYFENIDDNLSIPLFAGIAGSFYYLNLSNESLFALVQFLLGFF